MKIERTSAESRVKTIMFFLNVKPVIVALVKQKVQYFLDLILLKKKFLGH